MQRTGAQIIVTLLERQGITHLSGIPGGASLPLYDALRTSSIHHVLARHEQGAGFIAQGMARVTGRPAVCLATSGPGVTNLLTALADARQDSIPLVAITAQVPLSLLGSDAFQEIDTYGLTLPITKHNFLVRSAAELLEVIPEAFRIAASGRPGPVCVDVPKNVQTQLATFDRWPEPGQPSPAPAIAGEKARHALELLRAAERPVLCVGGGVIAAGAGADTRVLAERADLPVAATLMGLGALPADHPLCLGLLGMHGARHTNLVLEACDLLLVAGARLGDRTTGALARFCPRARVVHIDIDASELGKIRQPELAVEADVGGFLRALVAGLPRQPRPRWLARVKKLKTQHPTRFPGADDPLRPYGLIRQVGRLLAADAIVTTDVGQHQMWAAQAYPHRAPRQWLTSGGLGTMGFGVPAAIGAALAAPERQVVCFSGDGSLLMNLQELATAAELGLNVKVVVLNNGHLGLVRQQQELFFAGRLSASRFTRNPDFSAIARGFGVAAWNLGETADPLATLECALGEPGPCLIDVPIPAEENVFPMVPPGAANHETIEGNDHAQASA